MDKNKKGRPKKDENEKKSNRVCAALNNDDLETLDNLAINLGLSRSETISFLLRKSKSLAKTF